MADELTACGAARGRDRGPHRASSRPCEEALDWARPGDMLLLTCIRSGIAVEELLRALRAGVAGRVSARPPSSKPAVTILPTAARRRPHPAPRRPWISLATSATAHAAVILALTVPDHAAAGGASRRPRSGALGRPVTSGGDGLPAAAAAPRAAATPAAAASPAPAGPPPPHAPPQPIGAAAGEGAAHSRSPTPTRPRSATRTRGRGADRRPRRRRAHRRDDAGGGLTRAGPEAAAATMESEARRIFGRPRLGTRARRGPAGGAADGGVPAGSIPRMHSEAEPPPRDSAARAAVRGGGRARSSGRTTAARSPGAHLQMLGTPYVTLHRRRGRVPVPLRPVAGGQLPHAVRPGDGAGLRIAAAGADGGAERAE